MSSTTVYTISFALIRLLLTNLLLIANLAKNLRFMINLIKKIVAKLFQKADIYPIKYYKKHRKFHKNWQMHMVK